MGSEAYEWQEGHFDGVIEGYREMLVRGGKWDAEDELLRKELGRLYELLPAPKAGEEDAPTPPTRATADPPDHLLMHVLHLAPHGHIRPHVDNKEAFGRTIVGLSLGGERVMRFCRAKEGEEDRAGAGEGPDEFDVLLRPGDVYVQR